MKDHPMLMSRTFMSTGLTLMLALAPMLGHTQPTTAPITNPQPLAQWRTYEQIAAQTQSPASRPTALWAGKAAAQKLPLTLVLDTQGRVVARHEGRIAPEAWDEVAELLP
jgi:hypothetical protein